MYSHVHFLLSNHRSADSAPSAAMSMQDLPTIYLTHGVRGTSSQASEFSFSDACKYANIAQLHIVFFFFASMVVSYFLPENFVPIREPQLNAESKPVPHPPLLPRPPPLPFPEPLKFAIPKS